MGKEIEKIKESQSNSDVAKDTTENSDKVERKKRISADILTGAIVSIRASVDIFIQQKYVNHIPKIKYLKRPNAMKDIPNSVNGVKAEKVIIDGVSYVL